MIMNTKTDTQIIQSIRTPFNPRPIRSNADTRRVLVNGKWTRPDPKAAAVLNWLRSN
jgi:hypothetical protein